MHPRTSLSVLMLAVAVACSGQPAGSAPATPPAAPPPASAGPPAAGAAPATERPEAPPTAVTPPEPGFATAASGPGASQVQPPVSAQLPTPAAAAVAPPVEVVEALALVPGATTPLRAGEQTTVDPGATFRVVLKGTFREARLSLLDAADAMQPSAGAREAGANTTVTLEPAAPLRPGTPYRLRVDGATTRELQSKDGAVRGPIELPILTAGEPPAEPKSKPSKKQRKRT